MRLKQRFPRRFFETLLQASVYLLVIVITFITLDIVTKAYSRFSTAAWSKMTNKEIFGNAITLCGYYLPFPAPPRPRSLTCVLMCNRIKSSDDTVHLFFHGRQL